MSVLHSVMGMCTVKNMAQEKTSLMHFSRSPDSPFPSLMAARLHVPVETLGTLKTGRITNWTHLLWHQVP